MHAFNERRLATMRDLLREAQQQASKREADALVARAANVLQGVLYRQSKVEVLVLSFPHREAK